MNWYFTALSNYANFSGRASRSEYWWFSIINAVLLLIAIGLTNVRSTSDEQMVLLLCIGAFVIIMFVPSLSVSVRRLHDTGRSGWWILIGLIPYLGQLIMLVFMLLGSETKTNEYGDSPTIAELQQEEASNEVLEKKLAEIGKKQRNEVAPQNNTVEKDYAYGLETQRIAAPHTQQAATTAEANTDKKQRNEVNESKQLEEIFANRYRLINEIGSGSFGVVWKAIDTKTNEELAIKISHDGLSLRDRKDFEKEYMRVRNMRHTNLLTARYYDEWDNKAFLVMPICRYALSDLVYKLRQRQVSTTRQLNSPNNASNNALMHEKEIINVLTDVTSGLAYLHSKDIIHLDLKPDNILCDEDGNWLISDFGISLQLRGTMASKSRQQMSGARAYASPEILHSPADASFSTDIFSLGVSIYEMATGYLPGMGDYGWRLEPDDKPLSLKGASYSTTLNKLMQDCVGYYPEGRPTAKYLYDQLRQYEYRFT